MDLDEDKGGGRDHAYRNPEVAYTEKAQTFSIRDLGTL